MAKYPVILLCGKAKSGKDTAGKYLAEKLNGICIAQADPIKRFCRNAFGLSEITLWGPSEQRGKQMAANHSSYATEALVDSFMDSISQYLPPSCHITDSTLSLYYTCRALADSQAPARKCLQEVGTWGRQIDPNIWSNIALNIADRLSQGGWGHSADTGPFEIDRNGYNAVIITDGRYRNEVLNVNKINGITIKIERPDADNSDVPQHSSETELDSIPRTFFDNVITNKGTKELLQERVRDAVEVYL